MLNLKTVFLENLTNISDDKKIAGDLIRLRLALIITSFGNGLTGVVLAVQIAQTLGASGVSMALTALGFGMLISFASGGIHADKANRVRAIVISDIVRAVANLAIVIGLLWGRSAGEVLVVLGCLVNGVCAGYFRPAQSSLWSVLVPKPMLKKTLSTNSLYNRISLAAGGAVGGILLAQSHGVLGIAIDAVSFFCSGALVAFNREPVREDAKGGAQNGHLGKGMGVLERMNILSHWQRLLSVGNQSEWLPLWVKSNIILSFTGGISGVCLPVVLLRHYSSEQIGLFSSVSVIALLVGALLARAIVDLPLPGVLSVWSNAGSCLAAVVVGLGGSMALAVSSRFSAYLCSSLSSPSFSDFVASQFAPDDRGKVYAMQTGASSVLAPLGMLLASMLLMWVSPGQILVGSSVLGLFVAVIPLLKTGSWRFSVSNQ